MINHVRTLLLNASSREIDDAGEDCWYVQPSFQPVDVSGPARLLHDRIFGTGSSMHDRIELVGRVMPFVLDPEFASFFHSFDDRVTVESDIPQARSSELYEFYGSMSDTEPGFVIEAVNSMDAITVFQHTGDTAVDLTLDDLHERYAHGFETAKRFSSCLYAMLLKYDLAYRANIGRAQA